MNAELEKLFHEVADLSAGARVRFFDRHSVAQETRREVEALLAYDSGSSVALLREIGISASRSLPQLDPAGGRCGPYRLLELIGSGGMGTVYLAERADGELAQRVAVKLLPPGVYGIQRERFLQERQILASLAHPNIARMLDAGHIENHQPFLAMEYVEGSPIDVASAGLTIRQKVELFLKVCAPVAYLHRNLIVHRDLKPGNILVTPEGEPKLLDFGIAKLLDAATDATVTSFRMLTPDYASPEQVAGGRISTATDIYSLGALLYRLLTGRPAHEFPDRSPESIANSIATREVTRPAKWVPELKGDLDCILLKALRKDPQERYATVEQFADDLEAFLRFRTVRARSGNALYRARKFLRRYWLPMAAAALVAASLSAGLFVANRERALAQRRFSQVRQLANKVLALDDVIRVLPGSTQARSEIVAISEQYLEGLGADVRTDPDLALEVAQAYFALARVEGIPSSSNLGRYAQAEVNLKKAEALLSQVLARAPRNRKALLLSINLAESYMILASTDHRREESLAHARAAAAHLEALVTLGSISLEERKTAVRVFTNIALTYKNQHRYNDAIRYARRAIDLGRGTSLAAALSSPVSIEADSLRFSGDLQGALQAILEARGTFETAQFPADYNRASALSSVLWRQANILGQPDSVSLERPAEAIAVMQQALDVADESSRIDPRNAHSRILLAQAARELGPLLASSDPARALAILDHAISDLRDVKENTEVRREEARLLSLSAYALRRLHRNLEARERIDAAFRLLRETRDLPANRTNLDDQPQAVLRASADQLAETGQPEAAAVAYRDLLAKIMAGNPDPLNDLPAAAKLSSFYASLASLDRRIGNAAEASDFQSRRVELWKHWQASLPGNSFVLHQLADTAPRR